MSSFNTDAVAISISLLMLVSYNVSYVLGSQILPGTHAKKVEEVMTSWIHKHLAVQDSQHSTLAMHSMRNVLVVATFVGSASFKMAAVILEGLKDEDVNLDIIGQIGGMAIATCLFLSFICMSQVVRSASQFGFLMAGHSDRDYSGKSGLSDELWKEHVREHAKDLSIKMVFNFRYGFRFLYGAIPFAFYATGPIPMLIGSFVMLFVQLNMDYMFDPFDPLYKKLRKYLPDGMGMFIARADTEDDDDDEGILNDNSCSPTDERVVEISVITAASEKINITPPHLTTPAPSDSVSEKNISSIALSTKSLSNNM